jgi:integrase
MEVMRLYGLWEDRMLRDLDATRTAMFFENLAIDYLEYADGRKSPRWAFQERTFFTKRFNPFFGEMIVREIRRPDVERYINTRLNDGASKLTINKELTSLQAFFTWCIRKDGPDREPLYDRVNPVAKLKFPEHDERYIRLTRDQIIELIEKSRFDPRFETLIMLAVFTGMRKSELLSLDWKSVDLVNRRIILRAGQTKTRRKRQPPIPTILAEYLQGIEPKEGLVVTLPWSMFQRRFIQLRESLSFKDLLEVDRLHFHDTRHIFAQLCRDSGIAIQDISEFLGHTTTRITEAKYCQSGGFNAAEKVDMIESIIPINSLRRM